jgi:hypothetical protein
VKVRRKVLGRCTVTYAAAVTTGRVRASSGDVKALKAIKAVVEQHPGAVRLDVVLLVPGARVTFHAGDVVASAIPALVALVGPENVKESSA